MDEKDKELLDFEPDEGDMEPGRNRDGGRRSGSGDVRIKKLHVCRCFLEAL